MNFDLKFYWGLFVRRLPVMLALFLFCSVSAVVVALKMPPTWTSAAQLLVEEPQIPDSMLRSVTQVDAGQQLQVIEQRLLTRANLLDIARKYDVFEDMRSMTPDAIVEQMRRQTRVRRSGGRSQATLMSVSFQARQPRIAADVVNEYVTLILQESSNFRLSRAESTLNFFEQEVRRLDEDLSLQSTRIVNFRNENADALPSDLTYRQNRLNLLQERQSRLERDISALEKQRQDMMVVFDKTGQVSVPDQKPLTPEEQQLVQLRADLQQALAIYSETNPRIALLRQRIARLEEIVKQQAAADTGATDTPPTVTLFEITLTEMEQRLEGLRAELSSVVEGIQRLEESIQATAGNAIALNALERDFANIQQLYDEAVANLNKARVTERIEVNAQGQRVTVLESASVPQMPSGPNRIKLIAQGVFAGLALAGGFFALLEMLNRTIRRPAEMQSKFGIIPLAVIPYMEDRRERLIRRAALICAFIAVLIGVPAVLWYVDTQYMPLEVLANKVFSRLGLT